MDFPVDLNINPDWVYNKDEIRQVIIALLSNNRGMFIQSPELGRRFDVHQADTLLIDEGIRQTLELVKEVSILDIKVKLPVITIHLSYKGGNIEVEYNTEK